MIEELNIDLLKKYGFTSERIEKLTTCDNYETPSFKGNKCFFASNIENRIYSGIDAARRYFIENKNGVAFPYTEPDLIPEYFKKNLSVYIEAQRKIAGAIFIEIDTINEFKVNEIVITQKKIKEYEAQPPVFSSFAQKINLYKHYLKWLNSLNDSEMITDRIQALFKFIDFLHSNISNFKKFDGVISELILLKKELKHLSFSSYFEDEKKKRETQVIFNEKFKVIDKNIVQLIHSKIIELKICDYGDLATLWNWNCQEMADLKKNYSEDDLPIILQHKKKYHEFRTEINFDYFNSIFYQDLDQLMDLLFNESKKVEDKEVKTKINLPPSVDILLDESQEKEIDIIELKEIDIENKNLQNTPASLMLLTSSEIFMMYELRINALTQEWINGGDKTGCAIFCNILLEKNLFTSKEPNIAVDFAKKRYNLNISVMHAKIRRKENFSIHEERTTEILRLITNTAFGILPTKSIGTI